MSKHMDLNDRNQIYLGLESGKSCNEIAKEIQKAGTTITREIRQHRIISKSKGYGRIQNQCVHRSTCTIRSQCEDKPDCVRRCASCKLCNQKCKQYTEEECPRLSSPPYVCNGCPEMARCVLNKWMYDPSYAYNEYRTTLSETRQGFNLTKEELHAIDECVSPLIRNGQSIHHACIHNRDSIIVSERTIERLVNQCALSARNIDLPRVCKLKVRKSRPKISKIQRDCRSGRTYQDYTAFCTANPDTPTVQMDSVIGRVGGKVFLTLIFPQSNLMLAFLRDSNTSQSVIDCINRLYCGLGHDDFCRLFPVLLTDNGSEFSHPSALEFDDKGLQRTKVFYCDPLAAYQKPKVERNHELIRSVLPQGTSFDDLSQEQVGLMMSHINSYSRKSLGDKSPFETFVFLYGEKLLNKLLRLVGQTVIAPGDIVLKPSLLK